MPYTYAIRYGFLVSYNKADENWAEWIAWVLEEEGHSVIIRAWDFQPGRNFVLDMQVAVINTNKTLVVLSHHYLNAEFTQSEWAAAFANDPKSQQRKLIPIRVEECQLTGLLKSIVYTDLMYLNEDEARQALLNTLPDRLKPDIKPSFPRLYTFPDRLKLDIKPCFPKNKEQPLSQNDFEYNSQKKHPLEKAKNNIDDSDLTKILGLFEVSSKDLIGFSISDDAYQIIEDALNVINKLNTLLEDNSNAKSSFNYSGALLKKYFSLSTSMGEMNLVELREAINEFESCYYCLLEVDKYTYSYELAITASLIAFCSSFSAVKDSALEWISKAESHVLGIINGKKNQSDFSDKSAIGSSGAVLSAMALGVFVVGPPMLILSAIPSLLLVGGKLAERNGEVKICKQEIDQAEIELSKIRSMRGIIETI